MCLNERESGRTVLLQGVEVVKVHGLNIVQSKGECGRECEGRVGGGE